ncbi:hypothetical protein PF003_g35866 [Phytophthora fragariae]|nr:hypothetical protein PF003_g35866 [Phytophthora fragariae]
MADAFVIGGDGVSLFASVGIMMPLASRQEDVSDPLKESDLRDRLMQDLGLSDTADSDEEEWAPDPTIALKLDGFREPLKDSELQDRLMKDLGLSDSDEEEWVPKTKLATLESEEEERHFKSQFDSKDSDEEEWIPSSEGEEEEEWRPKSRVDYKESDEEEWVSESITRFLTREPPGAQPQSHDQTSGNPVLIIQTGEATGSESSVSSALEECKPQITPTVLVPAMVDSLAEESKPRIVDQMEITTEVQQPYTVDRLDAASRLLENALVPAKTTTVLTSSNAAAQHSSEPTAYVSRPVCISFAVLDWTHPDLKCPWFLVQIEMTGSIHVIVTHKRLESHKTH